MWAAVAVGAAVASAAGLPGGPAQGHTCLQVDVYVPVTTTPVGPCAPHDPLTHFCAVLPVVPQAVVVVVTVCTDLVSGAGHPSGGATVRTTRQDAPQTAFLPHGMET